MQQQLANMFTDAFLLNFKSKLRSLNWNTYWREKTHIYPIEKIKLFQFIQWLLYFYAQMNKSP